MHADKSICWVFQISHHTKSTGISLSHGNSYDRIWEDTKKCPTTASWKSLTTCPPAPRPSVQSLTLKGETRLQETSWGDRFDPEPKAVPQTDRSSSSNGDLCNSTLTPPRNSCLLEWQVLPLWPEPGTRGRSFTPTLQAQESRYQWEAGRGGGPAGPGRARLPARLSRSPDRCSPSCGKAAWSSWLPRATDPPRASGRQEKVLEQHGGESASHTLLWEAGLPALSHVQFIPLGAAILGNGAVPVTWAEEAGRACALCLAACQAVCGCASFLWEVDQRKTSSVVFLWAFLFCFVWDIFLCLIIHLPVGFGFHFYGFFSCFFFGVARREDGRSWEREKHDQTILYEKN